jgi:hypothetical protein
MAVELCKVSLWMEALEPGKPLSFLEHHIQLGNSLLGTTPALLAQGIPNEAFTPIEGDDKEICKEFKRINKDERNKQMRLFAATTEPWEQLGNFGASLMNLDTVSDDSIEAVREKERMYEEAVRSAGYLDGRFWADTWCAAFVWKKTREFGYPITEEVFRRIERNPHGCEPWMRREIERLAGQYHFFHWQLAFPDVFRLPPAGTKPECSQTGWNGGFDVVLGNPPWERLNLEERQFFAVTRPDIAQAGTTQRRKFVEQLRTEDPALFKSYSEAQRSAGAELSLCQNSGRYPHLNQARLNTYILFVETACIVTSVLGRTGIIVPSGVATDDTARDLFQFLVGERRLVSLFDLENRERIFPTVDSRYRFALLTITGSANNAAPAFAFLAHRIEDLGDESKRWTVTPEELKLLNPITGLCPSFRTKRDRDLVLGIHHRVAPFILQQKQGTEWVGSDFLIMFRSDSSSHLYRTAADLDVQEQDVLRAAYPSKDDVQYCPVWEAKLLNQFDHRMSTYDGVPGKHLAAGQPVEVADRDKTAVPIALPRLYVSRTEVENILRARAYSKGWLIGYRDVARATDARTAIAAFLPIGGACQPLNLFLASTAREGALWLGCFNSFLVDYMARQSTSGVHLNISTCRQLPIINAGSRGADHASFVIDRVCELSVTSPALTRLAEDLGFGSRFFHWDNDRRFVLRSELDAFYFYLYGVSREDTAYILDTFPIVRRKDEAEHGEYRTKRVILEIYDAMAEAERAGVPYQTRLSPPPADVSVAHGPAIEPTQGAPLVAMPIADLVALPDGAWATPIGVEPENVALFALIDVLRLIGGEIDPQKVRIAAILIRKPSLAAAFMDDAQATEWFRLVGREARPLKGNVIQISQFQLGAADHPWADAISQLKGSGGLVVASGKWSASDRLPLSSGQDWISGRASVAVQLLGAITPADAEQSVIVFIRSVEDGTARRAVS